jgi:hypothetical protein
VAAELVGLLSRPPRAMAAPRTRPPGRGCARSSSR